MTPRVSIGIPLYRSEPFVDGVASNIERLGADVEVLVSDRHQDDDALGRLARRFAGDTRVRILGAADRIGWVDHYNALLRAGRGRYFLWMPHDDDYPAGFLEPLVACLDARPEVIMAFPRVARLGPLGPRDPAPPFGKRPREAATAVGTLSGPRAALRLLMYYQDYQQPFHGLFRRQPVIDAGLFLRHTWRDLEADMYWTFGLALLGELQLAPESLFFKRYHTASASSGWGKRALGDVASGYRVARDYARARPLAPLEHARLGAGLGVWAAARAVGSVTQDWPLPRAGRARVKAGLERLMRAAGL